jgi:hypothetical protein
MIPAIVLIAIFSFLAGYSGRAWIVRRRWNRRLDRTQLGLAAKRALREELRHKDL